MKERAESRPTKAPVTRRKPSTDPTGRYEQILRLQRQVGNTATGLLLSRAETAETAETTVQRQAAPNPAQAAAAAAMADAVNTRTRLTAVLQTMSTSSNATVRNTAQLYLGPSARLTYTPMTLRSDSAAIASSLGTTGTQEYLFTGVTQPPWTAGTPLPAGTETFNPGVAGTITGTTAEIRGRRTNGTTYSDRALSSFFTHESSHILVASYGEHPNTAGNSGSFDRYKDEFRGYFIDPYDARFGALEPDKRAAAIRTHLVGISATVPNPASNAYSGLQRSYWTNAAFKRQVDGHSRPDGFNITSSPQLDRLALLMTAARTDATRVDDVVIAISKLSGAERAEAAGATLVATTVQALGDADRNRVRRALSAPTSTAYTSELNPDNSSRVVRFYDDLVRGDPATLMRSYLGLTTAERARMSMNAAVLAFVDHHVAQIRTRASVIGMVNTRSIHQFGAIDRFIAACIGEGMVAASGVSRTAPSAHVLGALRDVTFEARLGFYRLSEDARRQFVEALPAPVARPLLSILRGDRDP